MLKVVPFKGTKSESGLCRLCRGSAPTTSTVTGWLLCIATTLVHDRLCPSGPGTGEGQDPNAQP